ncbi:MAG: NAD(+) synthase [Gammaproteobacteria bacterium]|nr:MAG: NAD(+) synthase [Gammaproteobacteria bacterium]
MNHEAIKSKIIDEMRVLPEINVESEIRQRLDFIKNSLINSGLKTLVLGISGGIDSTTLGKLTQVAINELNEENRSTDSLSIFKFIAIRLPYGAQADEQDAQMALDFIEPSIRLCINIKASVDAMEETTLNALNEANDISKDKINKEKTDFVKGNLKARARMVAQYQIAGLKNGLVLGTDHSSENITGFFTKWGDGACDLAPLFGLSKRQVKQIAKHLGAPHTLIDKAPTADLECLAPSKSDESVLGVSYQQIDNFLESKSTDATADAQIIALYQKTQHKRHAIPTIY